MCIACAGVRGPWSLFPFGVRARNGVNLGSATERRASRPGSHQLVENHRLEPQILMVLGRLRSGPLAADVAGRHRVAAVCDHAASRSMSSWRSRRAMPLFEAPAEPIPVAVPSETTILLSPSLSSTITPPPQLPQRERGSPCSQPSFSPQQPQPQQQPQLQTVKRQPAEQPMQPQPQLWQQCRRSSHPRELTVSASSRSPSSSHPQPQPQQQQQSVRVRGGAAQQVQQHQKQQQQQFRRQQYQRRRRQSAAGCARRATYQQRRKQQQQQPQPQPQPPPPPTLQPQLPQPQPQQPQLSQPQPQTSTVMAEAEQQPQPLHRRRASGARRRKRPSRRLLPCSERPADPILRSSGDLPQFPNSQILANLVWSRRPAFCGPDEAMRRFAVSTACRRIAICSPPGDKSDDDELRLESNAHADDDELCLEDNVCACNLQSCTDCVAQALMCRQDPYVTLSGWWVRPSVRHGYL